MFCNVLKIYCAKQLKLYKSAVFPLVFNILGVVILIIITLLAKFSGLKEVSTEQTTFYKQNENDIYADFPGVGNIGVFHKSVYVTNLMEDVRQKLQITEERVIYYDEYDVFTNFFRSNLGTRDFTLEFKINGSTNLEYIIRTRSNEFETGAVYVNNFVQAGSRSTDEYIISGFLALQYAIDSCYRKINNAPGIDISVEHLPSIEIESRGSSIYLCSICLVFAFFITQITFILMPIVEEKERGINDYIRIVTPYFWLNKVTFFITSWLIGFFIFVIAFYIVITTFNIYDCIQWWHPIKLNLLYMTSCICYSFMLSQFFSRVIYVKIGGLLYYAGPYIASQFYAGEESNWFVSFIKRFNTNAYLQGVSIFEQSLQTGRCFGGSEKYNEGVRNEMDGIYLTLVVNSIIFLSIFFTPSLCDFLLNRRKSYKINSQTTVEVRQEAAYIQIKNLTKIFKKLSYKLKRVDFVAVKDLSMDINKKEITVLLGHNGAGKTTTMQMLAGCTDPTSGHIIIDGKIKTKDSFNNVGYCPQKNILIPYFTVMDHLLFFGTLKGLHGSNLKFEAEVLLKKLKLHDKVNDTVDSLSGGMKRRLCLGNAIIGETKLVILDEPSSGLDPQSRRELWDILLKKLRNDHTILVTTHYMEEAEVLADSVVIIENGELRMHGPSHVLKKKCNTGHILKLLMAPNINESTVVEFVTDRISKAIKRSFVKPTLNITIPYNDHKQFGSFLCELEKKSQELGIISISLTDSPLEDVFLSDSPKCEADVTDYSRVQSVKEECFIKRSSPNFFSQIFAIFYKKFIFIKREWIYFLFVLAMPILASTFGVLSIYSKVTYLPHHDIVSLGSVRATGKDIALYFDPNTTQSNKQIVFDYLDSLGINYLNRNATNDVRDDLLQLEKDDVVFYNEQLFGALSFIFESSDAIQIETLFSGNIYHSSCSLLNIANNIALRLKHKANTVLLANYPVSRMKLAKDMNDFTLYLIILPLAVAFYTFLFVSIPFQERMTSFRHIQNVSPTRYWLANYLFDLTCHVGLCAILLVVHMIFNKVFTNDEMARICGALVIYGVGAISVIYLLTQLLQSSTSLYSVLLHSNLIATFAAHFFASADNLTEYSELMYISGMLPDFGLRYKLTAIIRQHIEKQHKETVEETYDSLMGMLGKNIFVGVSLMVLVIFVLDNIYRRKSLARIFCRSPKKTYFNCCQRNNIVDVPDNVDSLDGIVTQDKRSLTADVCDSELTRAYPLAVYNLKKTYNGEDKVKDISFSVEEGECFGLLGSNGAGKSTTFKMITQNTTIDGGTAVLNGMDCKSDKENYKNEFGYCPQTDALLDYMTTFETLKYMARVQGVQGNLDNIVNDWLRYADLEMYRNKVVEELSGGTKRKLNTAISLIAARRIAFLDEPTTGVDPKSRRSIWNCIQSFQRNDRSIVLTSHSMDECEYLCNRLAVMAQGRIVCQNNILTLKRDYNGGYNITIRLKSGTENESPVRFDEIRNELDFKLKCHFRRCYVDTLSGIIFCTDLKWSDIFKVLENLPHPVEDYAVNEVSLEEVVLGLSSNNVPEQNTSAV